MDLLSDAEKFLDTRSSFLLRPREQGDNGVWQQFEDGAFCEELPVCRASGLIRVAGGIVHSVSEEGRVSLPLAGLKMEP